MRGEITLKILETIKDLTVNAVDVLDAILSSGHGASYSKIQYELSKRQRQRNQKEFKNDYRRKYNKLIYKLKRDGLIKEKVKNNKKVFSLTKKGNNKLSLLKEKFNRKLPEASYQKETSNKFVIVAFDIPEKDKRKREWLRVCLRNLGLKMFQKSVWIGKVKIPKQFVNDLFRLKLIDFVEIFEINKTGSLEHLL